MSARSSVSSAVARAGLACLIPLAITGCDAITSPRSQPPAVVHGLDRISFAPTMLPLVDAVRGRPQPIASLLNVTQPLRYGEYRWNERDVPPGRVWVLVDLQAQTMSVFRGMHEIGTAVTLYGVDGKPTPTGRFPILARLEDHWSSIYDAPMPYTLRLTGDGVAIHGSNVREGAGTHGCLGVPLDFGRLLFGAMRVGDEVLIVHDGGGKAAVAATNA